MRNWPILVLLSLAACIPSHAQTQINQFQILQLGKQTTSPGLPSFATAYFYLDNTGHLACTNSDGSSCLSGGGGTGGCTLTGTGPCTLTSVFGTAPIPPPAGQSALSWDVNGNPVCSVNGGAYALCPSAAPTNVVQLAPAGTQTVVQPISGSATTQLQINNLENARYADQFNWTQSPAGTISAGSNTITLNPCPVGVDTSNNTLAPYSVYVATQGTPEAVAITGGTCTTGAASGTIIFTAVNTHSAGYTVQSASGGLQEAINDAGTPNSKVVVSPIGANANELNVYATVYADKNKLLISGYGGMLGCYTRDRCLFLGDQGNVSDFDQVRVEGLRFDPKVNVDGTKVSTVSSSSNVLTVTTGAAHNLLTGDTVWLQWYTVSANISNFHGLCKILSTPTGSSYTCARTGADFTTASVWGWTALENAAVEDNAEGSVVDGLVLKSSGSAVFHQFIIVDNDQAFDIEHLHTDQSGVRCTANFCGNIVLGRNDGGNASVIKVGNSELSMQCAGNGIMQLSGNGLSVSDTVIQGFSQYGIYYEAGFVASSVANVYQEVGSCPNPIYPNSLIAAAGLVSRGQEMVVTGLFPIAGVIPIFATTGATQRNYFIVPQSSGLGTGPILFAGYANTNGSGTINIYWPEIPADGGGATITYDVLYTTNDAVPGPYLGHATSLVLGTSGSCTNGVCTYADTLGAGSAYSYATQNWQPNLWFWPGEELVTTGQTNNPGGVTIVPLIVDAPGHVTSSLGITGVSVIAKNCSEPTAPAIQSPVWIQCDAAGPNAGTGFSSTYFQQVTSAGSGPPVNSKGRLIFDFGANSIPYHVFTVGDSNSPKTRSTIGYRPTNDANDCYVGFDATNGQNMSQAGMSFGCAQSISNYIGNVGDNTSYLERLTSSAKTIAVPINYAIGAGTAQAQTAAIFTSSVTYVAGMGVKWLPTANNTAAAPTLTANTSTAKAITKCGTVALVAGDITTTEPAVAIYDGTEWVLQNPQAIPCGVPTTGAYGAVFPGGAGAGTKPAANATFIWSFVAPVTVISSTKFGYNLSTADNTVNLSNIAIFNSAGNIVCQMGATAGTTWAAATGARNASWTAPCGPIIANTRYYLAVTSVTSTPVLAGQGGTFSPVCGVNPATNSTTASAVWTTPITFPADSITSACVTPQFIYY